MKNRHVRLLFIFLFFFVFLSEKLSADNHASHAIRLGTNVTALKNKIILNANKKTLNEGEDGFFTLSLVNAGSNASVKSENDITFILTPGAGNTANATHYKVAEVIILKGGSSSVDIPIKTLTDKILFNDELLVIQAANSLLGSATASIWIKDITALDLNNCVVSISDGMIYNEDTISIQVHLPDGVTSAIPIDVALNTSSESDLGNRATMPAYVPNPIRIEAGANSGEVEIAAANSGKDPAKLILEGAVLRVPNFKVNEGVIMIMNEKIVLCMSTSINQDFYDEYAHIINIEKYPNNEVEILNINGSVVWKANGYNNEEIAFRGQANQPFYTSIQPDGILPPGVYYYKITFVDSLGAVEEYRGNLLLKREIGLAK